jgi:hypothetical protein
MRIGLDKVRSIFATMGAPRKVRSAGAPGSKLPNTSPPICSV